MATSNITIYELNRNNIINAAMRKLAALAKSQTADSVDLDNGAQALNALVAEFQTLGMPLWARSEYNLTLVANTRTYTFGVGQTTNTPFPLKVYSAVLSHTSSGTVSDVFPLARTEFNLLNTSTTGRVVNYTYQPFINYGVLSVWPKPDANTATNYTLKLTYQRPFDGFNASGDTPYFPQEWQNALIYNLAVSLAPEFGIPLEDRQLLMKEAAMHLDTALQGSGEEASLFFQVDRYPR